MKFRIPAIILAALLLSACNFSLAEDVTPPPNYVAPTPMPTLGPLYPAAAPDIENGRTIYAVKCSACHGPAGMGDGDQGKQLSFTVTGLGLPQVGRAASPAVWYEVVTVGNMERSMPPFVSLNDQERWDVVAYSLTFHTTPEQIARGQSLFESNCAACPLDFFKDQTRMSSLSAGDLVQLLKSGSDQITAIGGKLSDDDLYAVAAYLRTLTFAVPSPTPVPATSTSTVIPEATPSAPPAGSETLPGTPAADGTPIATEVIASPTPEKIGGKVTGSVSGEDVAGLTVTLRGYDHTSMDSGPQEVVTLTSAIDAGGNYTFEGVEMPENRIYIAEVEYQGVTYQSDSVIAAAGATELFISSFALLQSTSDFSTMSFTQVHYFVDIAEGVAQVIGVYTFSNTGEKTITVQSTDGIPFLEMPADAENIGFDLTDTSAPLISAGEGFALQPSETPYGIVAYYTVPYDGKAQIVQPFALPAASVLVLVPDGVKLKTDQLTEGESQNFQGTDYQQFVGGPLQGGESLTLDLSGTPKTGGTAESNSKQNLLIGVGALGLVLILAGVWMYMRDRNRPDEDLEDEVEEQDEFETEEEILDAIIALDDLHRAGRIPDETYQARRSELKDRLQK